MRWSGDSEWILLFGRQTTVDASVGCEATVAARVRIG